MSITLDLTYPFYGGAVTPESGGPATSTTLTIWPVALGGHGYQTDLASNEMHHLSIPLLRQQADQAASPAETSLNPDDLWRRAQDSWHRGAGQRFRDRPDSDPERFYASKGIDIWERYQASLLPDTDQKRSASSQVVVAGSRLYSINGTTLEYTTDVTPGTPTFTTVTTGTPGAFVSLCSDGFTVYATDGADVWSTNTGITTKSVYNTLNAGIVAYEKGRLMAAGTGATKNAIYNITSGTPPSALFTHPNSDFTWVGFSEGQAAIYAAGYSGDKSLIYRIAVKPDASSLDQPVIAGQLPDGEIVRSIGGYLGFIFLGTDLGWRFCTPDSQGNLTIGSLVETPHAVLCFEGQKRFVWFGYTNYDSVSTGLGRMDLTQVVDALVPAHASDLMVSAQANVTSVVTFQNRRVFTAGAMYAEETTLVSSGILDSGYIGYGLPDKKVGLFFDVRTNQLDGSYTAGIAADGSAYTTIGSESTVGSTGAQFPMNEVRAERFEARLTLTRSVVSASSGPTIVRWTMKASPAVELREYIYIPVLLHNKVRLGEQDYDVDVPAELEFIKALRASQAMVLYQEGRDTAYTGQVTDYDWRPFSLAPSGDHFNGTCVIKFKRIV